MEVTVSDFLSLCGLEGVRLVAGQQGADRVITRTNVMDNPDSLDWLMPGEFLMSTGYLFRENEALQRSIIPALAQINCAGLCIKVGRYLDTIPSCMLREADRLDFPIIALPFGYSLSAAAELLNQRLFAQNDQQLEKTLEIHREVMRTALTSNGLFKLTETLVRLIGNPVLVTDSSWNLLCCVDRPDNPLPLDRHLNTAGKQPPFPEPFLQTLPDGLRHYKKAVTRIFSINEHHSVPCRILPIAAHSFIYGYLIVWESVRSLGELDYVALEQVAVVAALERIRAKEVEQTKLRVRKDFLDDLLSGNIESQNAVRSLAKLHGLQFESRYRCLVVRWGPEEVPPEQLQREQDRRPQETERIIAAADQAAAETGVSLIPIPRGVQLVLLADLGQEADKASRALRRMAHRMVELLNADPTAPRILVVAGKTVPVLSEVSRSLQNAQNGVHMTRTTAIREQVVFMDDFAAYQLLSEHVNRDALRRFSQAAVGPLLRQDAKSGTQLVETLEQYFLHNGSISDAAKSMYIHRNTYIYRLEKIKGLLNTDLKNSRKLLELQLGLLAYRILEH
ncbi:PucR family transcriptional regulator [Flavonifractor hominis]|uniref:PucR family transcriptional regulator ligand-binding domain-containing protein n=1 Tax=Flavonifractor hominis TaxID=3133178 RepID=A0ABV1ENK6_9FIRM